MSFVAITDAFFKLGKSIQPGIILQTAKAIHTMNAAEKDKKKLIDAGLKSNKKYVKTLSKIHIRFGESVAMMGDIAAGTLGAIGVLFQLADAMGILDPLIQFMTAIFQMMGAAAMESLIPSLEKLFGLLNDEGFVAFITSFGEIIGKFFSFVIDMFISLFDDPNVQKAILTFMKLFVKLIEIILGIVAWFVSQVASLPIEALLAVFVIIATIAAFWWGFSHGGPIVGAIMAAITGVTLGILAAGLAIGALAEGGIVTKPTIALIGEKGPEGVIPLGEEGGMGFGGDTQEIVWATEDTNKRLDILIMQNERKDRMKRLRRR